MFQLGLSNPHLVSLINFNPTKTLIIYIVKLTDADLSLGNIIEWSMPREVDLEGIEFKAIASGLHHVKYDFM